MPTLKPEEIRQIILRPMEQEVMDIEPPVLVGRIINDLIYAPGPLPLLSFTMSELYRMYIESGRTNRTLNEDDYNKLDGVSGIILKLANKLYGTFDRKHKYTLHKIILRMVTFEEGEPTGKKVLIEELEFSEDENSRVITIIDQLVEARLILKDRGTDKKVYVIPAHHALIKDWKISKDLIKRHGTKKIQLLVRLNQAVSMYISENDKRRLWDNNPDLGLLKNELKTQNHLLNKNEVNFIRKSIKRKKQKRNIKIVFGFILLVTVFLGLVIYRIARANDLASRAQLKLEEDPMAAIRLAEKAYYLHKNKTVMKVLSAAAATTLDRPFYSVEMPHNRSVNDAVFSPSGSRIITASSDNTARLWDLQGNLIKTFPHDSVVYSAVFSPDGNKILTVSRDNSAKLWDLKGNLLQNFMHKKIVTSAVFSPDGGLILTASNDNTAMLWDLHGKPLKEYLHRKDVKTAVFSPGCTRILTVSNDKIASMWDLQGSLLKSFKGVISA